MYLESHKLELQIGDVIGVSDHHIFHGANGEITRFEECNNTTFEDCPTCQHRVIANLGYGYNRSKCLCPNREIRVLKRAIRINKIGEI